VNTNSTLTENFNIGTGSSPTRSREDRGSAIDPSLNDSLLDEGDRANTPGMSDNMRHASPTHGENGNHAMAHQVPSTILVEQDPPSGQVHQAYSNPAAQHVHRQPNGQNKKNKKITCNSQNSHPQYEGMLQ